MNGWPFGIVPGIITTVEASGAGTGVDKTMTIGPADEGETWILLAAEGWHNDDGGNRTQGWSVDDNVTDVTLFSESQAAGHISQLYADVPMPLPLVLNKLVTCNWTIASLGNTKVMYLRYVVAKIRGYQTWVNT